LNAWPRDHEWDHRLQEAQEGKGLRSPLPCGKEGGRMGESEILSGERDQHVPMLVLPSILNQHGWFSCLLLDGMLAESSGCYLLVGHSQSLSKGGGAANI